MTPEVCYVDMVSVREKRVSPHDHDGETILLKLLVRYVHLLLDLLPHRAYALALL